MAAIVRRTLLTELAAGVSPGVLANNLLAAVTERTFAVRMRRPDRLATRRSRAADGRRRNGGGTWRRGVDRLAPTGRSCCAVGGVSQPDIGTVHSELRRAWLFRPRGALA